MYSTRFNNEICEGCKGQIYTDWVKYIQTGPWSSEFPALSFCFVAFFLNILATSMCCFSYWALFFHPKCVLLLFFSFLCLPLPSEVYKRLRLRNALLHVDSLAPAHSRKPPAGLGPELSMHTSVKVNAALFVHGEDGVRPFPQVNA